ncbi:glutamate synthase-related protein [Methanobacterium alcaliphilum]|uniref:glutamate synthase-related protein n=1 Tax=Methanobacterium alcaliphilum TaxID=392018 RepID=UPI002009F278|nr:glutamate synthase-related protein [Methanobacterium alcaliphilum]MCK9152222.1 glutamate synthase-related protein [Methanobacterium alcaliphilum]
MVPLNESKKKKVDCICSKCPSYPQDKNEKFFCFNGKSLHDVPERGCLCSTCPIYTKYNLNGIYFCDKEHVGDSLVLMRKKKHDEDIEIYQTMVDIKTIAKTGESVISSMGSPKKTPYSWDDIHFIPAQLYQIPLNQEEICTNIILGKNSKKPLQLKSPIMISALSYGAVSKKVKEIIATVAKNTGIGFNSGEGGVLKTDLELAASQLIIQYSTGRFGLNENILKQASAIEIRFGQGAYPGKGSYLPAHKMNEDIKKIRGLKKGEDSYSPAHHPDILTEKSLKEKVEWLRKITNGAPIGVKIACGNIEKDLEILINSNIDFITIDGFGGGTGAVNPTIRDNVGLPLIAALPRAVKFLKNNKKYGQIDLIASGGLRTSADIVKCLAMGANAVYIGTAALIAINCQQHKICHTGMCPTGITTHKKTLLNQLNAEKSILQLENFINVSKNEIKTFTRILGKKDINDINQDDLVALDKDLATLTNIEWLNGKYV